MQPLTHLLRAFAFASALLLTPMGPSASGQAAPDKEFIPPYEKLAKDYLAEHGLAGKESTSIDFKAYLDTGFVRADLGVFDVRYPKSILKDHARLEELRACMGALLDVQSLWLTWFADDEATKAVRADIAVLKKSITSAHAMWSRLDTEKLDWFTLVDASDKDKETATRLSTAMLSGAPFGLKPKREGAQTILLSPNRLDFLQLACFIGWVDPEWQSAYWVPEITAWTEFFWVQVQVIALEYPPSKPKNDDLSAGTPMNLKEPTGMVQHVAMRAAHSLCWFCFDFGLEPAFEAGLAQNFPIELYGLNNTRSGGAGRGNSTDGYSMFIPGGASSGGGLPPISADSLWRSTFGADYFLKPLKEAQKIGGKEGGKGKDRLPFFELTADDKVEKLYFRGPYFGTPAENHPLPAKQFLADYREFFRAYKSCFVHWLFEIGGGKNKKASQAHFAELLRKVAAKADDQTFESVLTSVYSLPWSAQEEKPESLEWQFLEWMSKQK